jgi:hypothetical protein
MFLTFNFSFNILATILATFPNFGPILVLFSGRSEREITRSLGQVSNYKFGSFAVLLGKCISLHTTTSIVGNSAQV